MDCVNCYSHLATNNDIMHYRVMEPQGGRHCGAVMLCVRVGRALEEQKTIFKGLETKNIRTQKKTFLKTVKNPSNLNRIPSGNFGSRTPFEHVSNTVRTPLGRLPDASRTPPGRLPELSRAFTGRLLESFPTGAPLLRGVRVGPRSDKSLGFPN